MTWTNIEAFDFWQWLYFIGRIATMKTMWVIASCLLLLIIKYQSEKPQEEKSEFDILFRDSVIVAFLVHFWFCMVYTIALYIPIPLKEENCLWIGYLSHFMFLLPIASWGVTMYIKMVMVFRPNYMEGYNMKSVSIKAFWWKFVISTIAILLDWTMSLPLQSPLMIILTKKTNVQA